MNRKAVKILSIFLVAIMSIFFVSTVCLAADDDLVASNITGAGANVNVTKIGEIGNGLAKVIRNVGIVAAVIILMYIGIKYMLGSAEEKAEYKKVFMPYLIGAVLLFSAAGIAQAIITFSGNVA